LFWTSTELIKTNNHLSRQPATARNNGQLVQAPKSLCIELWGGEESLSLLIVITTLGKKQGI